MSTACLKWIAMILMTMDHIGVYIPGMPVMLRWVGRLSAPLFFFCSMWALDYTRNRKGYIFRLYIASVLMSLLDTVIIPLLPWTHPYYRMDNNIFYTLFITAVLAEIFHETVGEKKKRILYYSLFSLYQIIGVCSIYLFAFIGKENVSNILVNFLPLLGNCFGMEGGYFVVLGLGMYILKEDKKKLAIFYLGFSALIFGNTYFQILPRIVSFSGRYIDSGIMLTICRKIIGLSGFGKWDLSVSDLFFYDFQWMMVFALPFLLMYNHKRGKQNKYFFYVYYPAHLIVLYVLGCIMA